jgi:hypothetical protein
MNPAIPSAKLEGDSLLPDRFDTRLSAVPVRPEEASAIEVVDPSNVPGWDSLVAGHTTSCFFHGAAWPRVLHEAYGHKPLYLVKRSSTGVSALVPLMEVSSPLTGRRGVSLPFTDFCLPLGVNGAHYSKMLAEAIERGRKCGWKYFEGRGGFELLQDIPSWRSFYVHTLDLTIGEENLSKRFGGSLRTAIRKAESSGVKVEISTDRRFLRDYYGLHCQTRRGHGLPPQPFSFFEKVQEHVLTPGQGGIALASLRGKPIAGAVYFHFGKRAIYKYGASDKAAQPLRANNLLMWEVIKKYQREGFSEFHFGRTSIANEGLRRYKLGYGTHEETIRYFRYSFAARKYLSGSEAPPDWKNRLCSHLPQSWLRFAGWVLYRHMS